MAEHESGQFERALDELEKVVGRLEREDLTLDESVTLFKKGRELATRCERLLTEAQRAIDAAMKNGEAAPAPASAATPADAPDADTLF